MVSPIDPSQTIARLSALMRQAGGAQLRQNQAAAVPAAAAPAAATLRDRMRAIAADHPRRARVLSRMLVESLLTDEFGSGAANDAAFQAVVDDVLDAMERDPGLSADLAQVTSTLL